MFGNRYCNLLSFDLKLLSSILSNKDVRQVFVYHYLFCQFSNEYFQEELGIVHGKIRALMESNRNDLPPVEPVEDKPSPLLTPTDVAQLPIEMQ